MDSETEVSFKTLKDDWDEHWRRRPIWNRAAKRIGWAWRDRPRPILAIKYFIQRGRRGYSDHDAWDFFTWNAEVVSKLAADYLKRNWGHPCGLVPPTDNPDREVRQDQISGNWSPCVGCGCSAEWTRVLTVMRDGFASLADENDEGFDGQYNLRPEVEEALDLYRKHYLSLWL